MNILVTGATGFIGSRLISALTSRGYSVKAMSRNQKLGSNKVKYVKADVFDEEQLESERLKLLVRMMLGYMMQLVFYSDEKIDIEFVSNEVAGIIYFYLSKKL